MQNKILNIEDYPTPKTIIFIGPEGKGTWIGSEKGLRDMYPFARVIKTEEKINKK